MLRIRCLLSKQAVLAAGFALLTASCASVFPSQVRTVRQRKDVPPGLCGYMGRVVADTADDASLAEMELRQQAGRRGANTVLLIADPKGTIHGKAYFCHPQSSGMWPLAYGGTYGPNVPVIQYYPPGMPMTPVQSRN